MPILLFDLVMLACVCKVIFYIKRNKNEIREENSVLNRLKRFLIIEKKKQYISC